MIKPTEISRATALAELSGALAELMPFPCDADWDSAGALRATPRERRPRSGAILIRAAHQPIVIRFGQHGIDLYQCGNELMRLRMRDDVVYVVSMMLRAYNLGLHSARLREIPFIIDCELLLHPA